MVWLIAVNSEVYEKYTSTLRAFGGRLQVTHLKEEAKRLTRKRDALRRAHLINTNRAKGWCTGPAWQYVKQADVVCEQTQPVN